MIHTLKSRHLSANDLSNLFAFATLFAMLALLSQTPLPETPKTGDITAWFGWVVTMLAVVVLAALLHLRASAQSAEKVASLQTEKMENVFKTMIDKLDFRQEAEVKQRELDRNATIEGHKQITVALGEVNKGQIEMTHEIVTLRTEVLRANSGQK